VADGAEQHSRRPPTIASSGPSSSQTAATVQTASTGRQTSSALPNSGTSRPCARSAARQAQQALSAWRPAPESRHRTLTTNVTST
jgi:hypothetical protein